MRERHLDAGDDAVRPPRLHVGEHIGVIHPVDVVARQDHEELRPGGAQDVEILVNRIGRAAVPGRLVEPLLRRQQIEKFVHLGAQKRPAHLQMPQQAVRFVLGEDSDATDVRIEAIRQRKIYDAELAAEKHGGLGAAVRQLFEAAAAAARQHQRERTPRQPFLDPRRGQHGGVPPTTRLTQSGRRGEPIRKGKANEAKNWAYKMNRDRSAFLASSPTRSRT